MSNAVSYEVSFKRVFQNDESLITKRYCSDAGEVVRFVALAEDLVLGKIADIITIEDVKSLRRGYELTTNDSDEKLFVSVYKKAA